MKIIYKNSAENAFLLSVIVLILMVLVTGKDSQFHVNQKNLIPWMTLLSLPAGFIFFFFYFIKKGGKIINKKEQFVLLERLNQNPNQPTLVVDAFQKEIGKGCTRAAFMNLPLKESEGHLIVYIDDNAYEYKLKKNKWFLSEQKTSV